MQVKDTVQKIINKISMSGYLCLFLIIMMMYVGSSGPKLYGEWDDYALVTASIINEGNFGVSANDITAAKDIFAGMDEQIDAYTLSGFVNKHGEEMGWYFPTYSIICVPLVVLFRLLHIPAIMAFGYTNLFCLLGALYFVATHFKFSKKSKVALIAVLSINPIIFYLPWISAEVLIYSLMVLGIAHWVEKDFKRAAFYISLASTLNPVILGIGIVMILEWFINLASGCSDKGIISLLRYYISCWKKIVIYGLCYVVALIPLVYNFYNIGHFNLTASQSTFTEEASLIPQRFLAYLFDFNFGFITYYSFLFILSMLLIIVSFVKRKWRYLEFIGSFYLVVVLYSVMRHINCGMSGISRYNAWNAVIMIFAVIVIGGEMITGNKKVKIERVFYSMVALTVLCSGTIVYRFGPMYADRTSYVSMTPIVSYILDKVPALYNPLPSTFNSRVNHIDGGYDYETPVLYISDNGEIKKILATAEDKEVLLDSVEGPEQDLAWFKEKLNQLQAEESYISIPSRYKIIQKP